MAQTELFQVKLPYACFGITVKDNIVIQSAPIGKWMIGQEFYKVIRWVEKKKGVITNAD